MKLNVLHELPGSYQWLAVSYIRETIENGVLWLRVPVSTRPQSHTAALVVACLVRAEILIESTDHEIPPEFGKDASFLNAHKYLLHPSVDCDAVNVYLSLQDASVIRHYTFSS